MSLKRTSNIKHAFNESFNTIGLASLAAISMATLNPIPILIGIVAEAAFLLFVPDSKWYTNRLEEKYDKEVIIRRVKLKKELWQTFSSDIQVRFSRLENLRAQMVSPTYKGQKVYRTVMRKLDYLLEKFLMFASKQVQFQQYLVQILSEVSQAVPGPPPVFDEDGKPTKRSKSVIMSRKTKSVNLQF